ncbi:putative endonuclease 4 [Cucumispora dikerogammari]|nr:putative endonuclease 4 [Cucumispora dikerogammari]
MIGAHIGISTGIDKIKASLTEIGAEVGQIFVKSNRSFAHCKALNPEQLQKYLNDTNNLVVHGTYLTNLANVKEKTISVFHDELKRVEELNIKLYVLHPGANVLKKPNVFEEIASHLNKALREFKTIHICIENMAGQGTVVCSTLEEIAELIKHVEIKDRIGVCFDTCHAFAAGYNIKTKEGYEKFISDFDRIIGLDYLKVIHLNDSKEDLGCKKDRHECIGKGKIGADLFKWIVNDKRFSVPMILETPDVSEYANEIKLLKGFKDSF